MGRVRALLAALVTVCGLLLGAVEVLAAETGKLEITSGGTVIRDGQEIEVIFSLEGFSEIKSGNVLELPEPHQMRFADENH